MMAVVINRGGSGMEPTVPIGASSTAVAIDGSGGDGVVSAAVDNNDDTMASAVMASSTNSGGAATWQSLSSTVQRRLMPLPPSGYHC